VPHTSVQVGLKAGTARLRVRDLPMHDYSTLENALIGGGPPPARAVVSFTVVWHAMGERMRFDNAAQQFRGVFRLATAQMAWAARTDELTFQSAPLETSTSEAAELGRERNGAFYVRRDEEHDEEA
jgi:hypothetical protein